MAVAGGVPAMILGLMKVLPTFITFYTPSQAVGFVLLFIGLTFALLQGVSVLDRRQGSGSGSGSGSSSSSNRTLHPVFDSDADTDPDTDKTARERR